MVQLRDESTHRPLPGIVVGEIGPKMGLKAADNGFLQLNQVRIPRDNMLMKNAQVEADGTFIEPKSDKLTYGTMVFVRVVVIDMVAFNVARAATIAVRYSCVRRQSEIERGKGEVQILDYQAQQFKLLPSIALSHAFKATFVYLMSVYREVADDIELRGELETLGELHAMSSGLKALSTELGANAIETCRRATGGHGYLLMSGLPRLYAATVAACTYEGENTVLYLQTARYLLKILDKHQAKHLSTTSNQMSRSKDSQETVLEGTDNQSKASSEEESVSMSGTKYLCQRDTDLTHDFKELHELLHLSHMKPDDDLEEIARNTRLCQILILIMKSSAKRNLLSVRDRLSFLTSGNETGGQGMSPERAWIACQLDLISAARSHLIQFLLTNYLDWVSVSPSEIRVVMTRLCLLLFYTTMTTTGSSFGDTGEYIRTGLKTEDILMIRQEITQLLSQLRPDAVSLVDAFDFHDVVLMSSLGELSL